MVSKKYKENFSIISNNKIISGTLVFTGTSFLDEWEDEEVSVDVSGNKLTVISAPGEHNKDFLKSVVLDGIASCAQRDYRGYEAAPGHDDFIILTETLAKEKFPQLFQTKTLKNKKI